MLWYVGLPQYTAYHGLSNLCQASSAHRPAALSNTPLRAGILKVRDSPQRT